MPSKQISVPRRIAEAWCLAGCEAFADVVAVVVEMFRNRFNGIAGVESFGSGEHFKENAAQRVHIRALVNP